jgi:hypothetical protein
MFLDTRDGVAILGYAGLGKTSAGMEPSEWMSNCLRGRKNLTLEASLSVLAKAMEAELPRHLKGAPTGLAHHVLVVPAFVNGEPRLYTLQLELAQNGTLKRSGFTRHVAKGGRKPPKFGITGSGGLVLFKDRSWMRPLTRIVRAADRRQLAPHLVPKYFAQLNDKVQAADPNVSSRCIVAWRNRKGGVHKGGGSQEYFDGTARDRGGDGMLLPHISNGQDWAALITPFWEAMLENLKQPWPPGDEFPSLEFDTDQMNNELAALPTGPDEKLK